MNKSFIYVVGNYVESTSQGNSLALLLRPTPPLKNNLNFPVKFSVKVRLRDPVPRKCPLQLFLSIAYNVKRRYYWLASDGTTRTFCTEVDDPLLVLPLLPCQFESLLDRSAAACHDLLSKLDLCEAGPQVCEELANEIIHMIGGIVYGVSEKRRHFRIRCVIERKHEVTIDAMNDESTPELEEEEEERNLGMLPAHPKEIRLECVKIEGESESCTICMEVFTGTAASMPCNHLFHGKCIEKWLAVSHYCPICRYQMPTTET